MSYPLRLTPGSSHRQLLAWAGQGEGRTLLDVGSGNILAPVFREQGWKVSTLDRVLADYEYDLNLSLPTLAHRFDAIVLGDILEHLVNPRLVLGWLRPYLAPGGRLLVSVPNVGHLYARLRLFFGDWPSDEAGIFDATHFHFWTRAQARGLLVAAGYEIIAASASPAPIGPARWLSAAVARWWPTLFGYQTLLLARENATDRHWRVASEIMP